jgi:hypothetical protein
VRVRGAKVKARDKRHAARQPRAPLLPFHDRHVRRPQLRHQRPAARAARQRRRAQAKLLAAEQEGPVQQQLRRGGLDARHGRAGQQALEVLEELERGEGAGGGGGGRASVSAGAGRSAPHYAGKGLLHAAPAFGPTRTLLDACAIESRTASGQLIDSVCSAWGARAAGTGGVQ